MIDTVCKKSQMSLISARLPRFIGKHSLLHQTYLSQHLSLQVSAPDFLVSQKGKNDALDDVWVSFVLEQKHKPNSEGQQSSSQVNDIASRKGQ